ncbi:MAG: hypothetical protein Q9220_007596 [cf. Caloplaca sp. 1 TL-2023]
MDSPNPSPSRSGSTTKRHSRNISYSTRTPSLSSLPAPEAATTAAAIPIPPTPVPSTATPQPPDPPLSIRPKTDSPPPRHPPEKDLSFLLNPSNFHPLPTPPFPSISSPPPPNTPLPTLLAQRKYHHAATLAAQSLTQSPAQLLPASEIFSLIYTRLLSLTLCSHTALAAQESLILGDIHSPFYLSSSGSGICILPWPLRLLATRLQAIGSGDRKRGVQGCYDLAFYARTRIREGGESEALWRKRLRELGVLTANALVEMGDLEGARGCLESLVVGAAEKEEKEKGMLRMWIAMVAVRMGDLGEARRWIEDPNCYRKPLMEPLLSMASGDYDRAVTQWRDLIAASSDDDTTEKDMLVAKQNLAVCLLYIGCVDESTALLTSLLLPPTTTEGAHISTAIGAITFNLATIYELTSDRALEKKTQLAERIMGTGLGVGLGREIFKL